MKELVKPNKKEDLYQNAEAYCEVYCAGGNLGPRRGSYSYSYTRTDDCEIVADPFSDDILF